jgi:peptide/nickel transport system substrate-binding protein
VIAGPRSIGMVVAVAALASVACEPPDRGPRARPLASSHQLLRIALKDPILTLDPSRVNDEASSTAAHALFDTLVDYEASSPTDEHAGYKLVPRLAERWTISQDGRRYTFWLRSGLRYGNGWTIVADDFVFSLARARAAHDSPFAGFLSNVVGVTSPRDGVLEIELAHPDASFLHVLTMSFTTPQRKAWVETHGEQIRRRPLASGPYLLEEWREGERLRMIRNPYYWDPARGRIGEISIQENVPRDVQFLMFERGELDSVDRLSAPDYLSVTQDKQWAPYVMQRPSLNSYGVRMDVTRKPFDDRRVRQAMNYAFDKRHVIRLLHGTAVASHGLLAPGMFGRDETLEPYPCDPERARALFTEALGPGPHDFDYVILADEESELFAGSLQHDLEQIDIHLHLTQMSLATWLTAIGMKDGPAFSTVNWLADYADPSDFMDALFHSRMIADESSNNNTRYANPELDALLDRARFESDAAVREQLYHRAERILYVDAPWIWGYHQRMTEVIQPYVKGYAPHPVWLRDYTSAWIADDDEPSR